MLEKAVLRRSKGAQVKAGDRIFVRYEGVLQDGSIFDRNFDFTEFTGIQDRELFSFVLGQGQVIKGWELGLSDARLGQVLKLIIPPDLAYGNIERPGIPANSALEFTVEIVGYSKGDSSTPVAYDLTDIGVKLSKYGLSDSVLKRISTGKIGLDLDDRLDGTPGSDLLIGLAGKNQVAGGFAPDILISTTGADEFRYLNIEDSLPGKGSRDLIAGFRTDDRIDLTGLGEGIEFNYIGNKKFSGIPGEVRFDKNLVGIDFNGDRNNDFEIEFAGKTQINASSFLT
jgi:Ca2+-binding RTX toxin-like protein